MLNNKQQTFKLDDIKIIDNQISFPAEKICSSVRVLYFPSFPDSFLSLFINGDGKFIYDLFPLFLDNVAKEVKHLQNNKYKNIREGSLIYQFVQPYLKKTKEETWEEWEHMEFMNIEWVYDIFYKFRTLYIPKSLIEKNKNLLQSKWSNPESMCRMHNQMVKFIILNCFSFKFSQNLKKNEEIIMEQISFLEFLIDLYKNLQNLSEKCEHPSITHPEFYTSSNIEYEYDDDDDDEDAFIYNSYRHKDDNINNFR